MIGFLPGTQIETELKSESDAALIIDGIFSCGGLVLSQVSALTGVEPYTVQNWVKRGFCSSPKSKKYSRSQFFRIVTINMLKDTLPIQDVTRLLSYINGHLDDESDDMISDDRLYMYFFKALASAESQDEAGAQKAIKQATSDYTEPFPGGKTRLEKVLDIMLCAYYSSEIKRRVILKISEIE